MPDFNKFLIDIDQGSTDHCMNPKKSIFQFLSHRLFRFSSSVSLPSIYLPIDMPTCLQGRLPAYFLTYPPTCISRSNGLAI